MSHEQEAGLTEVMLEENLAGSAWPQCKYSVILNWEKQTKMWLPGRCPICLSNCFKKKILFFFLCFGFLLIIFLFYI